MDKREALEIAEKYVDSICFKYDVQRAIMFGSFAKGTFHEDSDIDIAIVIKDVDDIIDTQIDLMKLRRGIDFRIEPHPFMYADFNRANPVVNEILKSGVEIRLMNLPG
jgi:predicted nucleotidyltransferase